MSQAKLGFLLSAGLSAAIFFLLLPEVGPLGALAGVGACFLGAAIGGGPFVLYAVWREKR